jgi:hypothetical protein
MPPVAPLAIDFAVVFFASLRLCDLARDFMAFSSHNLLRQLNQAEIIDLALELKNRKEALAFLLGAVRHDQLNRNQLRNALHALFKMAFPENTAAVVPALIAAAAHEDIEIRFEAVQLVVGMVRLSTMLRRPLTLTAGEENAMREAIRNGLTAKVQPSVSAYFRV